jgi:hypothetical protein
MDKIGISNLKIILARTMTFAGAAGFKLNFLQFLAHQIKPLSEFFSFNPNHHAAVMTLYVSFGTRLKVPNQDGIFLPTLGTGDIDSFVFEHQQISSTKLSKPPNAPCSDLESLHQILLFHQR